MPLEQIDTVIQSVEHEPHREHLKERLQVLARAGILEGAVHVEQSTETNTDSAEMENDHQADKLAALGQLTSSYFGKASNELGPDATEDQIWDKVFEDQISDLQYSDISTPYAQDLATDLLVNNLFAVYGQPAEEAKSKLDDRMWKIAQAGLGLEVSSMASNNQDVCVVSSDPEMPYHSISEQVSEFGPLFYATTRQTGERFEKAAFPVEILADATLENKAWFFAAAISRGETGIVEANKSFIREDEASKIASLALQTYNRSLEDFNAAGIAPPVTSIDYAKALIDSGRSPVYNQQIDYSTMAPSDQNDLFGYIADKLGPQGISNALFSRRFTSLSADHLDTLESLGMLSEQSSVPLASFKDLPPGTYDRLKKYGYSGYEIVEGLGSFDITDKKQIFDEFLESDNNRSYIFSNPNKFDFVSRDHLLELAREKRQLWTVASSINLWTDGSDQVFLTEMLDSNTGAAINIAGKLDEMPGLDRDWFVEQITMREDFPALAACLGKMPDINQHELFDQIMQDPTPNITLDFRLSSFDQLDSSEVLTRLLDAKEYGVIALNPEYFTSETSESLVQKLAADPEGLAAIASRLYKFASIDKQWFAESLVANGQLEAAGGCADELMNGGVDIEWLYGKICTDPEALKPIIGNYGMDAVRNTIGAERLFADALATGDPSVIGRNLDLFDTPHMRAAFIDLCIDKQDSNQLFWNLDRLDIEPMQLARKCFDAGWEYPIASRWHDEDGGLLQDMAPENIPTTMELLAWGAPGTLLTHLDRYPDTPVEAACELLLKSDDDIVIAGVVNSIENSRLPIAVAERLAAGQYAWIISKKKELFDPAAFTPALLITYLENHDESFADIYEYSGQHIDWIDKGIRDFGRDASRELLAASRELNWDSPEPIPEMYTALGVTMRGNVGIDQLRSVNTDLRKQFMEAALNPQSLATFIELTTTNPLARSIAKKMVRFDSSEWGSHGDEEWSKVLHNHLSTQSEHAPIRAEFIPSGEYGVRTIDAKEFDPSKIDEDAQARYTTLQADITAAAELMKRPPQGRYAGLFDRGQKALTSELERLATSRAKYIENGKEKAVGGIDKRIAEVTALSQLSAREFIRTFQNDFTRLSSLKIKDLDSTLRVGIFARALQRSEQARTISQHLQSSQVDFDALSKMDNFVDHIVNQDVFKDYFRNEKSRKSFENLSDTTALRKQITKIQSGKSSGQTSLKFIPSRGLALEVSGHMGDACWASKYDSIAKEFPNVTAITYVRNPGTSTERLVGASLAIDTTDVKTGEPVMVLRGINPIENYANNVKVEDVMEALLDYAKSVAGGRKIAVVIDGGPGQAATNRPVVHEYLKNTLRETRTDMQPISLGKDSTFNGYVLSPAQHPVYQITS